MKLVSIGVVESGFDVPSDPFEMREKTSRIQIHDNFAEGLHRMEESRHVQVLFGLHLSDGFELITENRAGDVKGVFASRSPSRPSPVGMTTVKLLSRDGNVLNVVCLDAVNGSPIYDLKPLVPTLDSDALDTEIIEYVSQYPRRDMAHAVRSRNAVRCLLKTAEIHGHFCPGSALGVVASLAGLSHPMIGSIVSEGMEDLIAIVEVNACFADGVQMVSGCTLGNNALIYRDLGRHAVTFAKRDQEQAVRVRVLPRFRSVVNEKVPEFFPLMEKVIKDRAGTAEDEASFKKAGRKAAFAVVQSRIEEIVETRVVRADLPRYAPITETTVCGGCGEELMSTKAVQRDDGASLCRACARHPGLQVEGRGIVTMPNLSEE